MAAANAALPWTTACSPYTMTLPGADTMKVGAMGDEAFRDMLGCNLVVCKVLSERSKSGSAPFFLG